MRVWLQSSLQLVEVLLTDLPDLSGLTDPDSGAERQRFVTIRDAWEFFSDETALVLVRLPSPTLTDRVPPPPGLHLLRL